MALFTSRKNIISTKYFLSNYYGISYSKKNLSHDTMLEVLVSKGKRLPKSVLLDSIDQIDITSGKVVLVRDVLGRVVAYKSPMIGLKQLEWELKSDVDSLREIRKRILLEQGLYLQEDDSILTEEELSLDKEYDEMSYQRVRKNKRRR